MNYPTLDQANLTGKKVLLRAGFDVPIKDGVVTDTTRIDAIADTMQHVLREGAALIIMAHQARPEAKRVPEMSQRPLVPVLEKILSTRVQFAEYCDANETQELADSLNPGEVLLLENLRYEEGEKSKDEQVRDAFGKRLAALAGANGVYVNDAFTNCHRNHASMTSVPKFMPEKYLGFNAAREVEGLSIATNNPAHPVVLAISGAKSETKVPVVEGFMTYGDHVVVGGCVANTFVAVDNDVGASKYDQDWVEKARELLEQSHADDTATLHIPTDAVVAAFPPTVDSVAKVSPVNALAADMSMFDVGPETTDRYVELVKNAKTIIWNGPLGFSELPQFAGSSKRIADAIVEATKRGAKSVLGGGDTLSFLSSNGYAYEDFTYVSTAGGAMLDFISGKKLPALEALK